MEPARKLLVFRSALADFTDEAHMKTCSQEPGTSWQAQALAWAQTGEPFNITGIEAPEHQTFCEWLGKEYRYWLSLDAHNVQKFRKASLEVTVI